MSAPLSAALQIELLPRYKAPGHPREVAVMRLLEAEALREKLASMPRAVAVGAR